MKIEKIPPLQCPICKSKNCQVPRRGWISCFECRKEFNLSNGKEKKMHKDNTGKGHNPRYDTGDYLE